VKYNRNNLACFQAGRDYEDLPETSNLEYSEVVVPNITVNLEDSYAGDNGGNTENQVNIFRC